MEKYGKIPKKFTPEWFEYVWDYYKWHIIAVVALVAAVIYTWYTLANRTVYDLNICLAGENIISQESKDKLCASLENKISDINGDGEKNIKIMEISVPQSTDDYEFLQAMEAKLYLELQAGDTYLYLLSEDRVERLCHDSSADGLFEAAEGWHGMTSENQFFVNVEKSGLLAGSGMIYHGLWAGVRNFVSGNNSEHQQALRNNAVLAANAILEE